VLNNDKGIYLEGRISMTETSTLVDLSEEWYNAHKGKMIIENRYSNFDQKFHDVVSLSYFRLIGFSTGYKFIGMVQENLDEVLTVEPYNEHFKKSKTARKGSLPGIDIFDESFSALPVLEQQHLKNRAEKNLREVVRLSVLQGETLEAYRVLPIKDETVKELNENGVGITEGEYLLNKLVPSLSGIDFEDDNLLYELFFIKKRADKIGSYAVPNMGPRGDRKGFFNSWWGVFRDVSKGSMDPNNDLDAVLLSNLFDEAGNNLFSQVSPFDVSNPKSYSEQEFDAVKMIISVLKASFGRHTFKEMYSGRIFPKFGKLIFINQHWNALIELIKGENTIYDTYEGLKFDLFHNAELIPSSNDAPLIHKVIYLVNTYFSPFDLEFDVDGEKMVYSVEGVNKMFFGPEYKQFSELAKGDRSLIGTHLSKKVEVIGLEVLESDRLGLYSALLKVIKSRGFPISRYNFIEKFLRRRFFAQDSTSARVMRKSLLDWLSVRGDHKVDLKYGSAASHIITLAPADFKFFEDIWSETVNALPISMGGDTVKVSKDRDIISLGKMKDQVLGFLNFIKTVSSKVGNKKIVIYPFSVKSGGLATDYRSRYFPSQAGLAAVQGELKEWLVGSEHNEIGFIFDPAHPNSFNQLFPHYLGLLLAEPSAFIIRIFGDSNEKIVLSFTSSGVLQLNQIIRDPKSGLKVPPNLVYSNLGISRELEKIFNAIVKSEPLLGITHYTDPQDFYDLCTSVSKLLFLSQYSF